MSAAEPDRPPLKGPGPHGRSRVALAALALLDVAGEDDALARRNALVLLALAPTMHGQYEEAISLHRQALSVAQGAGLQPATAATLGDLGQLERMRGNNEEAQRFLVESLQLSTELNDPQARAHALVNLSFIARSLDDLATARAYAEEAVTLTKQLGARALLAMSLSALLRVMVAENDLNAAAPLAADVVIRCRELEDRHGLAVSLEWLGVIAIQQGDAERGARLFGAAASIRDEIEFPPSPSALRDLEPSLERAKQDLGQVAYERFWSECAALDLDQAVAYALTQH